MLRLSTYVLYSLVLLFRTEKVVCRYPLYDESFLCRCEGGDGGRDPRSTHCTHIEMEEDSPKTQKKTQKEEGK